MSRLQNPSPLTPPSSPSRNTESAKPSNKPSRLVDDSLADESLADFQPPSAPLQVAAPDVPINVRRPDRPRFKEMSIFDVFTFLKARQDGGDGKDVVRREYVPPPPMSQAQFEAEVYGLVNSGTIRPEGADHLLAAMARANAQGVPGSASAARRGPSPEEEALARRLALTRNLAEAGIPDRYWDLRIDRNPFQTERGTTYELAPYNEAAFRAARRLAGRWQPGCPGLTLQSRERGVSKTLLAVAAGVYVAAKGRGRSGGRALVRFVKAGDLFTLFTRSYGATWDRNPGVLSTEQVWQQYAVRPDLLIIDDLGTEEEYRSDAGAFARERFYQLLDHRYGDKKTVLVTTQIDAAGLAARYGGHVTSRLLGIAPLVRIEGSPDYRPEDAPDEDADPFAE